MALYVNSNSLLNKTEVTVMGASAQAYNITELS